MVYTFERAKRFERSSAALNARRAFKLQLCCLVGSRTTLTPSGQGEERFRDTACLESPTPTLPKGGERRMPYVQRVDDGRDYSPSPFGEGWGEA